MKTAIIGSRTITDVNLEYYIPKETDEIISGGAVGVDTLAREYAKLHGLRLTEFLPEYERYGRAAPLVRNDGIIKAADIVLAFWDGKSHGTKYVIDKCRRLGVKVKIIVRCEGGDAFCETEYLPFTQAKYRKICENPPSEKGAKKNKRA